MFIVVKAKGRVKGMVRGNKNYENKKYMNNELYEVIKTYVNQSHKKLTYLILEK